MPYLFSDTAALVKRYYEEESTNRVDAVVDEDTTVVTTSLPDTRLSVLRTFGIETGDGYLRPILIL